MAGTKDQRMTEKIMKSIPVRRVWAGFKQELPQYEKPSVTVDGSLLLCGLNQALANASQRLTLIKLFWL